MTLSEIKEITLQKGLVVSGSFHGDAHDSDICGKAVLLLSPATNFWQIFTQAEEYNDGDQDPIDRWSLRVITQLAEDLSAKALFPFGGPPYQPFQEWARRSRQAWDSPVGLLVHNKMGLMISYRGALCFDAKIDIPAERPTRPCEDCLGRPCLISCPVSALGPGGYEVPKCKSHLRSEAGRDCMTGGCLVRRACPVSAGMGRQMGQSALHMKAFRGE